MTTSLKINDALKARVQHLVSQRRRSPHWIMLEAIQQYVEREEARESFKQEALVSWAAYQETGRHLTGQEVRTWLNTWGSNSSLECGSQPNEFGGEFHRISLWRGWLWLWSQDPSETNLGEAGSKQQTCSVMCRFA